MMKKEIPLESDISINILFITELLINTNIGTPICNAIYLLIFPPNSYNITVIGIC
jgi:hypothetical protein